MSKDDWLDLEWWEHPNGGIDWALLQGYAITLAMLAFIVYAFLVAMGVLA